LFSLLAIVSLALGIGANTAIYSFVDSILLRSLPVSDPELLVVLNWHSPPVARLFDHGPNTVVHAMSGSMWGDRKTGLTAGIFPFPAFELFQKNDFVFSSVFAYCPAGNRNLTIKNQSDIASGEYVSGDYFRGLAIPPSAGRLIIPDDDRAGAPSVAVISFELSQRRFGGPSDAAGQVILINNLPFTVVGVTPPGFFGVDPAASPDFYLPLRASMSSEGGGSSSEETRFVDEHYYWTQIMGRLRPSVNLAQAQVSLAPPFEHWVASTAHTDRERATLPSLVVREGEGGLDTLRRRYSKPLYVLMTLVGLMLAIACANVANLLLARAAARRREIALRLSVGAGGLCAIRQLLTESILLAFLGGRSWNTAGHLGDSPPHSAARQRKNKFHPSRRFELARARRGRRSFPYNRRAVRTRSSDAVHTRGRHIRYEGASHRRAWWRTRPLEPFAGRGANRRVAIDAGRRRPLCT
jgi:macrolide transport system ATP-binding/permease protein